MKKDEKQQKAQELHKDLEKARGVVLSGFEGITVAQDTELRRKLVQAGSTYRVVKNTLIERAAQGTSAAPVAQKLRGTTSLAYTESDPVALAKAISSYAKDHPILVFKAGVVEGRVVSMADLTSIANLPSREVLLAKVLYLINASAQRTASSIAGVARNLAAVIQQGWKEGKFQALRLEAGAEDRDPAIKQEVREDKSQEHSEAFRSLKAMIDRKLRPGGASLSQAAGGADPCDFSIVLPVLQGSDAIDPGSSHERAPDLYMQMSESERKEITDYYRSECEKVLKTAGN